ncbi:PAPA-1-like conserved region-domain-containing protein [Aspergillus spinulosporus]
MSLRRSLRARVGRDDPSAIETNTSTRSTRQTRAIQPLPSVTVVRAPSESPEGTRKSIHLTVRMPSSKLREAISGSSRSAAARRSHNVFTDNPIVTGPRTSRSKKKLVEINTSDDEEEEEEEEEEQDLDDQEEDEVDDEDAPGEEDEDEDADADGDVDMDDATPQPPASRRHAKAAVTSVPRGKPAKSVEEKEMELDEEDDEEDEEELSEPDSNADGEADDQEGVTLNMDEAGEQDEDEEDEELDSDSEMPDMSKLTKRQRGSLGNDFLQLPMEPQIKKHLTAEERAMRRAEMARRRKNLSEKRNEEEKMDTINRLLRKQAPKRRGRIPAAEAAENAAADQEAAAEMDFVDPTMVRWISGREGSRVAVPEEWIGTPQGRIFGGTPRKLVEEI